MMALAETFDSTSEVRYDPRHKAREMTRHIRVVSVTTTDTQSEAQREPSFSPAVRRDFLIGSSLILTSGVISVLGLVLESHWVSVAGAVILPISLIFLTRWVERGSYERKAWLPR